MNPDLFGFAYAFTLIVGGIFGYARAGSTMSLAAGLICGTLMLYGAYQTSIDPNNFYLSLFISAFLACLMGYRFLKSGKFMPAGLVMVFSVFIVIRFAWRVRSMASAAQAAQK